MGGLDELCARVRYIYDVVNNSDSICLGVEASILKYPLRDLLFFKKLKIIRLSCNNPATINTPKA